MKYGVFIQTNHKQITGALVAQHALRRVVHRAPDTEQGQQAAAVLEDSGFL